MTVPPGSDLVARRTRALATLERTCDLVLCVHPDGTVAHVGDRTAAALALRVEDLAGAAPETWLLPLNVTDYERALERLTHDGCDTARLRLWRRTSQSWRACSVTVTDLRADPDVAALVLTGVDESDPAGDGATTGSVLGSLGIGLVSLEADGVVVYASPGAAHLLGFADPGDVVGTRPFADAQRVNTSGGDPSHLELRDLLPDESGTLSDLAHLRLRRPDGSSLWTESRWQAAGGRLHAWIRESAEVFAARAERAGRDQRMSALLGGVGDYVAVLATNGHVAWASPSTRALMSRMDVDPARQPLRLVHPDDRKLPLRLWQAVRSSGAGARESALLRVGPPGGGMWQLAEITLTNHLDDPEIAGVILHARDVTALNASREIRRGTQEALMAGLSQPDPEPALEAVCVSLERLLGNDYPTASVTITHVDTEVNIGGETSVHRAAGRRARRALLSYPLEQHLSDLESLAAHDANLDVAPGELRVHVGPLETDRLPPFTHAWSVTLWGPLGEPMGILAVALENDTRGPDALAMRALDRFVPLAALLVARHRQHARTRASESRFRSVFHDTAIPTALVDLTGRFVEVNTALAALVGCSGDDLVATAVDDLEVPVEERDARGCRQWRTRSGAVRWIQRTAADVHDANGRVRYRVEHYVDITAQRTTEDEVRLLNEMLCTRITELDAAKDRLAGAFRKINQVREDERRRLAVDLHDDTIQELIGASWLLDEVDPDETNPDVAPIRRSLTRAVDGIRAIINDLLPPGLDVVGLTKALEHRAHKVLGDDVLLEVLDDLPGEVPAELSTLVFRTTGEALRNIRQHAGADHVEIALAHVGDSLVVKVTDNGAGFDPQTAFDQAAQGHIGVTSMREQILLAGGRFHIGARADGRPGTEVSFSLPRLDTDTVVSGWPY